VVRHKKIYKHETREKINKMFEICERRASNKADLCGGPCSKCSLSDKYEKLTGIRMEEINDEWWTNS